MADFSPGINVAQAILSGTQLGERLNQQNRANQIRQLQETISSQMGSGGFSVGQSQELARLSGLDPTLAANTIASFSALDENRQKAFFEDAQTGLNLLNSGDVNTAMQLVNERRGIIQQMGGDTSDVDLVGNLIESGQIDQAKQVLGQAVNAGIANGFLPPAPKEEKFTSVQTLPTGETVGIRGGVQQVVPQTQEVKEAIKQARKDALMLKQEERALKKLDKELAILEKKEKIETATLKKQEIQQRIDSKKQESEQKKRNITFEATSAFSNMDDSINTINSMLEGDKLESAAGFQANFPTLSGTAAADFEALLDTLQSQTFLSQVEKMKGLGALSENEGKKLAQAIGSLTIDQSDKQLRKELIRIKGTITEAKKRLSNKFNLTVPKQKIGRFTVEVE